MRRSSKAKREFNLITAYSIDSVRFAGGVPVPIGNVNNKVAGAICDSLTRKPAVGRQSGSKGELVFFLVAHFRKRLPAFLDNTVACRTCANASTCMVQVDSLRESDVKDAARQAGIAVGQAIRIDLDGQVHRQKCDGELLRRGLNRRQLVEIRIATTHIEFDFSMQERGRSVHEVRSRSNGRTALSTVKGPGGNGDRSVCPQVSATYCELLERSQFVHYDPHRSPLRGGHAHKLPSDIAFTIDDEGRWAGNSFLRMEHVIGIDECPQGIGQNGKFQPQLQDGLSRRQMGICA